jgi:hypothetical protein
MRNKNHGIIARVVALVGLAAIPAEAGQGEVEDRPRPITIVASPALIPKGSECRVELRPQEKGRTETVTTTYEGTIAGSTDEGVMLTVSSVESRTVQKTPGLSEVPLVNRLFRNVGIGRQKVPDVKEVWIPAEKVRSITLRAGRKDQAPKPAR